MKNLLVVLLILAVVVGSAFAQELKFTGEVRSGVAVRFSDAVDESAPTISVYSAGGDYAWRFTLSGAYTNAAANAGFNFNLRSRVENGHDNSGVMNATGFSTYAENAYAWLKALDNKITFTAGRVDYAGKLTTSGGLDTSMDVAYGAGIFTRIEPISNLQLGVGIFPNISIGREKDIGLSRYTFGASYTVPDTVEIVGIFVDNPITAILTEYVDPSVVPLTQRSKDPENRPVLNVALAAKILALKSLGITTAIIDAEFDDLTKARTLDFWNTALGTPKKSTWDRKTMGVQIGQKVTFAQGDLEINARFREALLVGDEADSDYYAPDLSFTLWGTYKLFDGKIVPGLGVGFNSGKTGGTASQSTSDGTSTYTWATNPRSAVWDRLAKSGYTKDAANLALTIPVEFRIGGGSQRIIAGYSLDVDLSKDTVFLKDSWNKKTADHAIFLDYQVSF